MKLKPIRAYWVHVPIPPDEQHTSDFGGTTSFDATLGPIDTRYGPTREIKVSDRLGLGITVREDFLSGHTVP